MAKGSRKSRGGAAEAPEEADVQFTDSLALSIIAGPTFSATDPSKNRFEKQFKRILIGRTAKSTFPVKDSSISERHAVIEWNGEAWTIQDQGSSNGTQLNGADLDPGAEPSALKDGDILTLGVETQVRVEVRAVAQEAGTVLQYVDAVVEGMAKRVKAAAAESCALVRREAEAVKEELRGRHLGGGSRAGEGRRGDRGERAESEAAAA